MTDRPQTDAIRLQPVPTETAHGRTPARDRAATTPAAPSPPGASGAARSPGEIEKEIEATRARLATTIDEIGDRVKPANVAARAKTSLLAQIRTSDGELRKDRVGALAGAVGLVLSLMVLRRRRRG